MSNFKIQSGTKAPTSDAPVRTSECRSKSGHHDSFTKKYIIYLHRQSF